MAKIQNENAFLFKRTVVHRLGKTSAHTYK